MSAPSTVVNDAAARSDQRSVVASGAVRQAPAGVEYVERREAVQHPQHVDRFGPGHAQHTLLVEPVREYFDALRDAYSDLPNVRFENVAIAEEEGDRNFYRLDPEQNIIRWTWVKYASYVERYEAAMDDPAYDRLRFVRLRTPHEIDGFLAASAR